MDHANRDDSEGTVAWLIARTDAALAEIGRYTREAVSDSDESPCLMTTSRNAGTPSRRADFEGQSPPFPRNDDSPHSTCTAGNILVNTHTASVRTNARRNDEDASDSSSDLEDASGPSHRIAPMHLEGMRNDASSDGDSLLSDLGDLSPFLMNPHQSPSVPTPQRPLRNGDVRRFSDLSSRPPFFANASRNGDDSRVLDSGGVLPDCILEMRVEMGGRHTLPLDGGDRSPIPATNASRNGDSPLIPGNALPVPMNANRTREDSPLADYGGRRSLTPTNVTRNGDNNPLLDLGGRSPSGANSQNGHSPVLDLGRRSPSRTSPIMGHRRAFVRRYRAFRCTYPVSDLGRESPDSTYISTNGDNNPPIHGASRDRSPVPTYVSRNGDRPLIPGNPLPIPMNANTTREDSPLSDYGGRRSLTPTNVTRNGDNNPLLDLGGRSPSGDNNNRPDTRGLEMGSPVPTYVRTGGRGGTDDHGRGRMGEDEDHDSEDEDHDSEDEDHDPEDEDHDSEDERTPRAIDSPTRTLEPEAEPSPVRASARSSSRGLWRNFMENRRGLAERERMRRIELFILKRDLNSLRRWPFGP